MGLRRDGDRGRGSPEYRLSFSFTSLRIFSDFHQLACFAELDLNVELLSSTKRTKG